jgi:hypothetical protein
MLFIYSLSSAQVVVPFILSSAGASAPPGEDATNWYVSNAGSDGATGHSTTTSFATIAKLNITTFTAGDTIFFNCGNSWNEELIINQAGSTSLPIVVTSYSTGARPIITGGVLLNGTWKQNSLIWATHVTAAVKALYVNGTRMTSARIPNAPKYYPITASSSTTIQAAQLAAALNYWAGGQARMRTNDYTWENRSIASSATNGTLTTSAWTYTPETGWGVFVDGMKVLIDTTNEWYCDGDSLWYQPASGVNPATQSITAIQLENGVRIHKNYVTVSNLEIDYQDSAAVKLVGDLTGVVIKNNTMRFQNRKAVDCQGTGTSIYVLNNTIRDCLQKAIFISTMASDSIAGNIINYIGMYPGYGRTVGGEMDNMVAIDSYEGSSTNIINNWIDTCGYTAIVACGHDYLIKYNYVANVQFRLNDGGGIYSYSEYPSVSYNNTWRRNIVFNIGANWSEATPSSRTAEYADAMALYLDGYTRKTLIDSNTVINSQRYGIFNQYESDSNTITANTVYRSGLSWNTNEMYYYADTTKEQYGGLNFQHNILFPRSGSASTLFQYSLVRGNYHTFVSDYNTFCLPYTDQQDSHAINDQDNSAYTTYTLAEWQAHDLAMDVHSTGLYCTYPSSTPLDSIFFNPYLRDSTVTLGKTFYNLDGTTKSSPFTLKAFESVILIDYATPTPITINKIDSVNRDGSTSSPITLSSTIGTVSNGYTLFIVGMYESSSGTADSATVDLVHGSGTYVKMDSLIEGTLTTKHLKIFGKKGLDAGAHTFRFYWKTGTFYGCLASVSLNNVNQTTPTGVVAHVENSVTNPTINITNTAAGNWTVGGLMNAYSERAFPVSPSVSLFSATSPDGESTFGSYKVGASTKLDWTGVTERIWVIGAVVINCLP